MNSIQIVVKESFSGLLIFGFWILFCLMFDFSFGLFLGIIGLCAWAWAFRNPERIPFERGENVFLAPIDGKISNIERFEKGVRICVDVGLFDSGLVRAPQAIQEVTLYKKSGLVAYFSTLKTRLNEHLSATISGKNPYIIRLFPSIFKHSNFYAPIAFRLGERMGFMKFGKLELEIEVPIDLQIHIGDKIKGGMSVIGYTK